MPRWTEAADPDFVGVLALTVEPPVAEQLGLTDNQRSQLSQLIDAQEHELVGLALQWKTLPAAERVEKLRAFRQAAEAKGLAFLSKQQAEKLLRLGRQRKGPALLAEAEVAERLQLTPEQRAQIATLLKDQAGRKGSSDERAAEAARADAEKKLAGILSTSQRSAWTAMIQSGPGDPGAASEAPPPKPAPKPADAGPAGKTPWWKPPSGPESKSTDAGPAEKTAAGPVKPEAKPEPKPEAKPGAKPSETAAAPGDEDVDSLMQDLLGEAGAEPPGPRPGAPGFGMPGQRGTPFGPPGFPGAKLPPGTPPPAFGQTPPKKPAERLKFNFSGMPWKDVIQWFADQNGLALQGDNYPTASFTYSDDKEYTPAEALDLLNSVLLAKGFTLVRKDRMLWVVAVDELGPGIPQFLVDQVAVEDLDERGNYELVSVFFTVEGVSPEEAQAEIRPLVVPPGSVITLAKARLLLVTETVARLKVIRRVLKGIEEPSNLVEIHKFRIDPQQGVKLLAALMSIPPDKTSNADDSFRYALDPSGTGVIMSGKPEKLKQAREALKVFDPQDPNNPPASVASGPPELKSYSVPGDPDTVYKVVTTMLLGQDVMISMDPKTGALLARARPAQHAIIRGILDQLQQPSARKIEVIQLRILDPQVTVLAITKMFITGQGPTAPTIDADPVKRQLLVRGSEAQISQIKDFLKDMGEVAGTDAENGGRNVIVLPPIPARVARSALEQLQQMWPSLRSNRIRVVMPSGSFPQVFPNGPPEAKAIDENGLDLPESPDQAPGMSEDTLELYRQLRDADVTLPSYRPAVPSISRQPSERGQPTTSERRGRGGPGGPFGPGGAGGAGGAGPGQHQHGEPSSGSPSPVRDRSTAVPPPASRQGPRYLLVAQQGPQDKAAGKEPAPALQRPEPSAQPPKATAGPLPRSGAAPLSKGEASESTPKRKPGTANRKESANPSAGTEGAPVYVGIGPGGVVIASDDPEALEEFERLFNMLLSMGPPGDSEMTIFYLKYAKAISVADTLDSIYSSGGGGGGGTLLGDIAASTLNEMGGGVLGTMLGLGGDGGGGARRAGAPVITADSRLNALFVQANPVDLDMIEQLLKILDRPGSPTDTAVEAKPRLIPVFNTQAQEVADVVRQVYSERLSGQGGGQGRPPNPQEILQALAGARGGGRGGGGRGGARRQQEELPKMSIGVDSRTNSLIVSAPDALFKEVEDLVIQLDEGAIDSNQTYSVVRLKGGTSPAAVQLALQSMMGSQAQVTRRSAGGSGGFAPGAMPGGFGPQMGMGGQFGGGASPFGGGGFGGRGGFTPGGGGGFQGGGRFGGGGTAGGGFPGGGGFSPGGMGRGGGGGMGSPMGGGGRGGGGMGGGGRTGGGGRGGGGRGGRGG